MSPENNNYINRTDEQSGLEEKFQVGKQETTKDAKRLMQYFIDKKNQENAMTKINAEHITTKWLEDLISEIKLDEIKKDLVEYHRIIKKSEMKIIDYIKSRWGLDLVRKEQTANIIFKWFDFEWIPKDLLVEIAKYYHNNTSLEEELSIITDENWVYSFNVDIVHSKTRVYIENITITEAE